MLKRHLAAVAFYLQGHAERGRSRQTGGNSTTGEALEPEVEVEVLVAFKPSYLKPGTSCAD